MFQNYDSDKDVFTRGVGVHRDKLARKYDLLHKAGKRFLFKKFIL